PSVFEHDVLAFNKARLIQSFSKRADDVEERRGGPGVEKSHHRHRRLLRGRRERPRSRRAAEKRDELASSLVGHGLLPGTRCASLPQAQDAPEAPAGPWGRPESF